MATGMITMKIEDKFLKEIDSLVEKSNYQNRTEFIREALREKVDRLKYEEARLSIIHLLGAHKGKKTTDEDLERIRAKVSKEYFRDV